MHHEPCRGPEADGKIRHTSLNLFHRVHFFELTSPFIVFPFFELRRLWRTNPNLKDYLPLPGLLGTAAVAVCTSDCCGAAVACTWMK